MKKVFLFLSMFSMLFTSLSFVPGLALVGGNVAFGQANINNPDRVSPDANLKPPAPGSLPGNTGLSDQAKQGDIFAAVGLLLRFVFGFIGLVVFLYFIYGGFLYITSNGDSANTDKARSIITNAVIGLIIIFLSYALANTLLTLVFGQGTESFRK